MRKRKIMVTAAIIFLVILSACFAFYLYGRYEGSLLCLDYQKEGMEWSFFGRQSDLVFDQALFCPKIEKKMYLCYQGEKIDIQKLSQQNALEKLNAIHCKADSADKSHFALYLNGHSYLAFSLKHDISGNPRLYCNVPVGDRELFSEKYSFEVDGIKFSLPLKQSQIIHLFGQPKEKVRTYAFP